MTYKNKLIALSSTAGGLALIILLSFVFSAEAMQSRTNSGVRIISSDQAGRAASVDMSLDGKTIGLRRDGKEWAMARDGKSYPAESSKVSAFLKALSGARGFTKVSSSKSDWAKFGLEGEGAKKVSVSDASGKLLKEVFIGSNAGTGREIYLAFGGSDAVWRVRNTFASYIREDDRAWGDLRIFPKGLEADDIQGVAVKAMLEAREGLEAIDVNYSLMRDAKKRWKVQGDDARVLDAAKVEDLAVQLADMQGDSFATDAAPAVGEPAAAIAVSGGKGEEYLVKAWFREETKDYVVQLEGSDTAFILSDWGIRSKARKLSEYEPEAPSAGE